MDFGINKKRIQIAPREDKRTLRITCLSPQSNLKFLAKPRGAGLLELRRDRDIRARLLKAYLFLGYTSR